jgi:hypothetical protein
MMLAIAMCLHIASCCGTDRKPRWKGIAFKRDAVHRRLSRGQAIHALTLRSVASLPTPEIGQGYDADRNRSLSFCIESTPLETLGGKPGGTVQYFANQITDKQDLQRQLKADASAAFKWAGNTLAAGAHYLLSSSASHYSSQLMMTISIEYPARHLTAYRLKQWVVDKLTNEPAWKESGFKEACGTHFISGVRLGGEFRALTTVRTLSKTDKQTIDVGVMAQTATAFMKGSLTHDSVKELAHTEHTIQLFMSGVGAVTLPGFDSLVESAAAFPAAVASAGGVPIAIEYQSYDYVENFPGLKSPRNDKVKRVMSELSGRLLYAQQAVDDCKYISQNRYEFDEVDQEGLTQCLTQGEATMSVLEDAAIECYEKQVCAVPTPHAAPYPRVPTESAPDPSWQFLARRRTDVECRRGDERDDGYSSSGCPQVRTCTSNGRWGGPEERCSCEADRSCPCPGNPCGDGTLACVANKFRPCACKHTCPPEFGDVRLGVCEWNEPNGTGRIAWTRTGTPEGGIVFQAETPAHCTPKRKCVLRISYIHEREAHGDNSCGDSRDDAVIGFYCLSQEGQMREVRKIYAAEVTSGISNVDIECSHGEQLVAKKEKHACRGLIGCRKGCVRVIDNASWRVRTDPSSSEGEKQCSF